MENEDAFVWSSELPPMILNDPSKENKRESLLGETRQARRESFMKNGALQKLAATYDNLQGIWQGEKAKREPHLSREGIAPAPPAPLQSQDLNASQRQPMATTDTAPVKVAPLPVVAPVIAPAAVVPPPVAAPPPPAQPPAALARVGSTTAQHLIHATSNCNSGNGGGATGALLQPASSSIDGIFNSLSAPSFTASGGGGGGRHAAPSSSAAGAVAAAASSGNGERLFDFSSGLAAQQHQQQHQHHNASSGGVSNQVLRHAVEIFEEPELADMCEEGLNKQLTRTKDGATEQSRIQELAGKMRGECRGRDWMGCRGALLALVGCSRWSPPL